MSRAGDARALFDLSDTISVVIGAGSGIGEASARGLADVGAHVVCADLDGDAAARTADAIETAGGSAEARAIDITDSEALDVLFAGLERVDSLVCTPSVNVRKPLLEVSDDEFDRVVELNLKGTFRVVRAAGRCMSQAERGSIVVFSSIRSQVVEPGQGVYAATKAGALQMVRALAAELGPRGVRANCVAPGVVETPLTEQIKDHPEWYDAYAQRSALKRWAQPQEMVGAVIYLCAPASSFVTGTLLTVDGGWLAVDGRFDPPL